MGQPNNFFFSWDKINKWVLTSYKFGIQHSIYKSCIYVRHIYVSYNAKIIISSYFNYMWRIDSASQKMCTDTHIHTRANTYRLSDGFHLRFFYHLSIRYFIEILVLRNQFPIKFVLKIQKKKGLNYLLEPNVLT